MTPSILVNDIHSQLNPTWVSGIAAPRSCEEIGRTIQAARQAKTAVCVAGGRHAMGGQQFRSGALLCDVTGLNRVLNFDPAAGTVAVEAGMMWPELIDFLNGAQSGQSEQWTIAQKQTGANRLTLGGAAAANIHGRGLRMRPLADNIETLTLVDAEGALRICSRQENPELFRLVVGGYGLFGLVYSVTLRLVPRRKVQRIVEVIPADDLIARFEQRIADGFLYGDFQFATDEHSDGFLREGVFSCYQPVDQATPMPAGQKHLSEQDWQHLLLLAHADKARAFETYAAHYLATSGQVYWSDTHQLAVYLDDYHKQLDQKLGGAPGTESITEIFVPRPALADFLEKVRADFRTHHVNLIYGTIRLIERDDESFLAWATEAYACVIFNLHVEHTSEGRERAAQAFRRLIDLAIERGGSYFLPYHKYATRAQVEACYPQFPEFLRLKRRYDPEELFQSDWYRHYTNLFSGSSQ